MLADILAHLRELMLTSALGIQHSNCARMRATVEATCKKTTENQLELFKYMNENGMYPIKNVTDTELSECIAMHSNQSA